MKITNTPILLVEDDQVDVGSSSHIYVGQIPISMPRIGGYYPSR